MGMQLQVLRELTEVITRPLSNSLVDEGKAMNVVYLGFSKVLDTVSHSILLQIVAARGLDVWTICYLKNWLDG